MPDKDLTQLIDDYEVGLTDAVELPEEVTIDDVDPRINTFYNNLLKTPQFKGIKIRETLRTPQQALRNEQKAKAGIISKGTRYSKHIFGGAMDIDFPTEAQYLAAGKMAETMGLKWGGVNDMGHVEVPETYQELRQGLPKPKTVEEAMAEIPDDIFTVTPQEVPLNAPGSQVTNVNPELGVTQMTTGPMGTEVPLPSWSQMGGDIATIGSILFGGPAIGAITKGVSKIPAVAKALTPVVKEGITKLPKMGQAIKTAIQSLYGAGTSAGIQVAKGEPENALEAAAYGAAIPIALRGVGEAVKIVANKAGDLTLGKWNVGKFINEKFGGTTSMKSLKAKNSSAIQESETNLQNKLTQYEGNRVALDPNEVDQNTLKLLKRAAVRADDKVGIKVYDDFISRFGNKGELQGTFTPAELNIIKRNMYDLAYSYKGDPLTSKAAKEFKSKAQYVRKTIESNTDPSIKPLNEEYAKHITLDRAINHQLNIKPGTWSWIGNLAAKAAVAGGATALGGPIATGVAMAAQTVPGFTSMGAVGKTIENPELMRILSTLLPQWLQQNNQ